MVAAVSGVHRLIRVRTWNKKVEVKEAGMNDCAIVPNAEEKYADGLHEDEAEGAAEPVDVPHEDGDADGRVEQGEDLAAHGLGDDISVTWFQFHERDQS